MSALKRGTRAVSQLCVTLCFTLFAVNSLSAQTQAQFNDPRIQAALQELNQEPTIQEVHRAALKFYNAEPETIKSMRSRANWKYALPDVNVRFRQSNNGVFIDKVDYLMGDVTQNNLIGRDESQGDVYEYQVSGTWSLSRLLFNPEVLDVSSLAGLQEGVLKEVTRIYYTRRRLQIDLILKNPRDPATRLSKELRIEQLTATLDALTQNLFAKSAAGSARVSRGGEW